MVPNWQTDDGRIRLYLGDCAPLLAQFKWNVDAVITDPPYGIAGVWKGGFSDKHGWGNAGNDQAVRNGWDDQAPSQAVIDQLLKIGTQHIIWGGNYFTLPISRCWLVWNKPERGFTLAECELAWTDFDSVARVWDGRRSDPDRTHPTQKPLELMEWCVQKTTGTVLDPYFGSGTTGIACVRQGRKFIGVEREEAYFWEAVERFKMELGRNTLFEPAPQVIQRGLPGMNATAPP